MALKFDIKSTQDCGTLKYTNCSTYCSPDNYVYEMLIASILPRVTMTGDIANFTTDILTSVELDPIIGVGWSLNGGSTTYLTNIPNTVNSPINLSVAVPGIQSGVNTITIAVTDINATVSVLTFAFNATISSGQWVINWLAIPEVAITTGTTLEVAFNNASTVANRTLVNTDIDTNTIVFNPDAGNISPFTSVQNYTYSTIGSYNINYEFNETEDNTLVSFNGVINIQEDPTDCSNQLTTTDISSVALVATSPSNMSYTTDISNLFFQNNFDVTTTMFGIASDTFESGIWTFQTIVTKVSNTGTFIFAQTIKVVLFCKEQCSFNSYVATYAEEELDCCTSCKEEKEKKIILMSTYIDAIKNASACGELNKITKFINLLQRLLSNKNCSC